VLAQGRLGKVSPVALCLGLRLPATFESLGLRAPSRRHRERNVAVVPGLGDLEQATCGEVLDVLDPDLDLMAGLVDPSWNSVDPSMADAVKNVSLAASSAATICRSSMSCRSCDDMTRDLMRVPS
jgi:hypothetical protein